MLMDSLCILSQATVLCAGSNEVCEAISILTSLGKTILEFVRRGKPAEDPLVGQEKVEHMWLEV